MSLLTRRQLLQTTAAAAVAAQLPGTAEAWFPRGGAAAVTPTDNTAAQAAAIAVDINHRLGASGWPIIYNPPWNQGASGGDNPGAQYASQSTLATSTFPTTMTLVQDGAVAAGVPTQSFGWVFRPGDIPAGHAPLFQVGGVTWPYSAGLQTYWPDGSLKWAAFALMVPASPPSFPATITISDGGFGTWPAASGRTLAEVYSQGIVVNTLTPTTPVTNNYRTVDLHAWLNGDGNQYYAVKDLDGAAGARWTIKTKMAQTVGGTPDPEFVVTHRVFALNNASGGLGGFRWFGEIRNPFYQITPSGPKNYTVFQPPSTGSPSTGTNWQTVGPGGGAAVYNPVRLPYDPVNWFNGASFTGFIDDGSGNGSPSGIAGSILTVTAVNYGQLLAGEFVTASVDVSDLRFVDIGGATTPAQPIQGYSTQLYSFIVMPDGGARYFVTPQFTSTEPDGHFGGRGRYTYGPTYVSAPFTNQQCLASNPFWAPNFPGTLCHLKYGSTDLTGEIPISYQLTASGGDQPGLRGRYQLDSSVVSSRIVTSQAMSFYAESNFFSDPVNNLYNGSHGPNVVPGVITGANLPPSPSNLYGSPNPCTGTNNSIIWAASPIVSGFNFYGSTAQGAQIFYAGPGAGTFTACPALSPYVRFQMANKDGKYNFFQGTPSGGNAITADTTLRVQINRAYWQSTCTFMPMDMSFIGTLPDTPFTWDWSPYSVGYVRTTGIDVGGPPVEVGLMTNTAGWDFYLQSFLTDKENRIFGLSGGTLQGDFKDSSSPTFDRLPPTNGPGVSYAGLPATIGATGVSPPNINAVANAAVGITGSGLNNPSHEGDIGYWAFLRFGELQFFDYMCEWANCVTGYQAQMNYGGGVVPSSPPFPYVTYGNVCQGGQYRSIGWACRDLQKIAFICSNDPTGNVNNPVFSDGTELQKYLIDHADDQPKWIKQTLDDANATTYGTLMGTNYAQLRGLWQPPINQFSPGVMTGGQVWQMAFIFGGLLYAALRGNSDAKTVISRFMNWMDYVGNAGPYKVNSANGYLHLYGLATWLSSQTPGTTDGYGNGDNGPALFDDVMFNGSNVLFYDNQPITWVPNIAGGGGVLRAFTHNGIGAPDGFQPFLQSFEPADGDMLIAYAWEGGALPVVGNEIPSALTQNARYYVRDLTPVGSTSGPWSFNLALTPGGSIIPITDTTTGSGMAIRYLGSPSIDYSNGNSYPCHVRNTINWLHAICTSPYGHNLFARFT